jgi:hypothetical protein
VKLFKVEQIIIILLWISILGSLCLKFSFNAPFILGIVGLSIVTITYKKFYNLSIITLFFILLFSIFNLIQFSSAFGLHLELFGMPISVTSVTLFFLLAFIQRKEISDVKHNWLKEDPSEIENRKSNKIAFFKNQFKDLPIKELERKLAHESLTDEAKQAIAELLKDTL